MESVFSIGQLAREFDVTTRTIRFYEDQGLLSPKRRGQTRLFDQRDRTRLKLILRGRRLGFPLAEVRQIVDLYDAPAGERRQLERLLAQIGQRRGELEAKRRDINQTLRDLDRVAKGCEARLQQLAETEGGAR